MTTQTETARYYVIAREWVGPTDEAHLDVDTIRIDRTPALTNGSREPRTEGYCGTTNDWSVTALGEFDTIEAARTHIEDLFGETRQIEVDRYDEDTVEAYKPGDLTPMGPSASLDLMYSALREIDWDTTDESIEDMLYGVDHEMLSQGYKIDLEAVENEALGIRERARHDKEISDVLAQLAQNDDAEARREVVAA